MYVTEYAWWKKEEEGIVAGLKQALGAVWWKTRLFNSGGQFDKLCNLIDVCNSGMSNMLAHRRAISAYGDGRSKVQGVCVCVCVCVVRTCMCV